MQLSIERLAEEILRIVTEQHGKRYLRPGDLSREMVAKYGRKCSKEDCRRAIHQLIDSGRCVYSYFGESYVTLPHKPRNEH